MPEPLGEPEMVARQHAELQRSLTRQIEASPLYPIAAPGIISGSGNQFRDSLLLTKERLFGETPQTRAARARCDVRAISAKAGHLPDIEVRVERSSAILKPADLLGTHHVKLLSLSRAYLDKGIEALPIATRIGEDESQLRKSLSLPYDSMVSHFDSVRRAMFGNFHSTYEMKLEQVYDQYYRASLGESYFAHIITLSQRAHAILLAALLDLKVPPPAFSVNAVFAVASDIPRFLPISDAPGADPARLWSLIPEFDIYLLENPRDSDSRTVERLRFTEFKAERRDSKGTPHA